MHICICHMCIYAYMAYTHTCIYPYAYTLGIYPTARQAPTTLARFGFLYNGYSLIYFEVLDLLRKLFLAAIPVFVPAQPFGSTQVPLQMEPTSCLHTVEPP